MAGAETLDLFLHTCLIGASVERGRITGLRLQTRAGRGAYRRPCTWTPAATATWPSCRRHMEGSPVQFPSMNFYMANVNVGEALTAGLATLQTLIKEAVETRRVRPAPRGRSGHPHHAARARSSWPWGASPGKAGPVDCADPG